MVYFISETQVTSKDQPLLVINFVGALTKSNLVEFEQCQEQVLGTKAKWIILNFRDVSAGIDTEVLAFFDRFRLQLKKKSTQVRFSGLHPDLKTLLLGKKMIHTEEIVNNLAEALQSFPLQLAA